MNVNQSVAQISAFRAPLMGFATIWVSLFHFRSVIGNSPFGLFDSLGYGAVDIFLFLSGFGLYSGYNNDIKTFYIRRFLRIYPTYFTVILIGTILRGTNIIDVIIKSTGVGYFLPFLGLPYFDWFVPTIYLLYLVFPSFMRISQKWDIRASVLMMSIIGLILTFIIILIQKGTVILTTSRIPIFFIGSYFGYLYKAKTSKSLKDNTFTVLVYLGLILIIVEMFLIYKLSDLTMWRYAIYWLPFIIITPSICSCLPKLLRKIETINSILTFIGSISFEFYLVHVMILPYFKNFLMSFYLGKGNYISFLLLYLLFFFISLLLTYPISKLIKLFNSMISKRILL